MQDKFTRQALQALKLAKTTAQSWKHSYIGTEHILAGLLKEKRRHCRKDSGRIWCSKKRLLSR